MNLNKIDNRTMAEKFDKDGIAFISMNTLWRKPLIPLHPLNTGATLICNSCVAALATEGLRFMHNL